MSEPRLPDLARSFERHLRAENKSDRTVETYLEAVRLLEAFLAGRGVRLAEADRAAAELPVARFAALAGIPERTYHRRLATLRSGDAPVKGPWPTPAVDATEALAAKYAADWPAWGHRKIAAMMRADGHQASTSTVERALRRRGLLLPWGFRADRKSWAALRRKVFHDPPTERNRVWQTDFSEFETAGGGIWRICAVIDYATKYCLAARITPTGRGVDALACLDAAVDEAERVLGLDDLRDDRGERELVDENTGEVIAVVPAPIAVVPTTARAFAARPTNLRSPAMSRCCATSGPASGARRPTASSSDSSAR